METEIPFCHFDKTNGRESLDSYSPKSHRLNAILRGSQIIKKAKIAQHKRLFITKSYHFISLFSQKKQKVASCQTKLLSASYQTASFKVRKSDFRCIFEDVWTSLLTFLGVFIIFSGRKNFSSACFLIFPGTIRTANSV